MKNTYEITICDVDPAILARNVVLFTLIQRLSATSNTAEQDDNMKAICNFFYHLYVSDRDLGVLQDHAENLLY